MPLCPSKEVFTEGNPSVSAKNLRNELYSKFKKMKLKRPGPTYGSAKLSLALHSAF